MHLNENLIKEIMCVTGVKSKTEAVMTALHEMTRKNRLKKILKKGLGLTPEELGNAIDPSYSFRGETLKSMRLAESPKPYGSPKKRSR